MAMLAVPSIHSTIAALTFHGFEMRHLAPAAIALLLAAAVIKLAWILARPGVNRLCVLSLLILVAGWTTMMGGSVVLDVILGPDAPLLARGIIGIIGFGAVLPAFVLSIVGLARSGSRPGEGRAGRGQGVTALVLSGLILLSLAFGALWKTNNRLDGGTGGQDAGAAVTGSEDFKEYNYRMGRLSRPWVRVEKGKLIPIAQALYTRSLPEIYLSVAAEKNEAGLSREDLQAVVAARMKSLATSCEEISQEVKVVGGVSFLRVVTKVSGIKGVPMPLCYDQWLGCTTRNVYQFTCWSNFTQKGELLRASEAWVRTFALLDMVPDAGARAPMEDMENPAGGWAVKGLGVNGWKTTGAEAFPQADLVARNGEHAFGLLAVPMPDTAGLRDQEIEDRILDSMGEALDRTKLKGPEDVTFSGLAGHVYEFERTVDKRLYRFRARILKKERIAWMVMTWAPDGSDSTVGEKAAACIRLADPTVSPDKAESLTQEVVHNRAMILNDLGIKLYGRQEYSRSMRFFQESLKLEPGDRAVTANLMDSLTNQERWREALDALNEFSAKNDISSLPGLKSRKARILTSLGENDAAAEVWAELFSGGYENQDHLLQWVNLELEREKPEAALKAVRDFSAKHPSPKMTRWEAGVLARMDQYPEALKLLEPLVEGGKPDFEALYLKGELENDAGRYEDAEKSATRLIATGEDTPRTRMILGWSEWHRKSWKAARAAFEKAAEKAPNDPAIREALSMTNGALGQGTAEVSSTPIAAVAIPDALRKAIAAHPAPPEELTKGHGAVQLERLTGSYFEPGKAAKVTQYYKVKVMDTAGVEAFSTLSLKFYPSSERVHVNKLIVRDESGATVQEGSTADAYTSGESGEMASGAQILRVPVPGLRRGCTLEAVITVEDKGKSSKPPFRRDLFVSGFPTIARACFFTGDSGIRILPSSGLTAAGPQAYVAFDLPAYRRETLSTSLEEWEPWLMAGPATADWKTPSLDYLKRLADRLKPDASTEKTAAQLCQGLSTPREKLTAIVSHVQSTLTYKGLEFGTRALIPSAVDKIQADHYGDCKDHTTLLYHLLRRAGIKCYPALVDTGWKIRQDIASLDQFDHMILYVPGVSENPWIDATDDGLDLSRFIPASLSNRQALVLDPENPRFETIPAASPTQVRIDREAALDPEGKGLSVEETLTLTGEYASWLRAWFLDTPGSEHPALVRGAWDDYANIEVREVKLTNAQDSAKPFEVRLKYTVGDALNPATGQLTLPFFWERDYLIVKPVENRRSPFETKPALQIESRTRLKGAAIAQAQGLSSLKSEGKTIAGEWRLIPATGPSAGGVGPAVVLKVNAPQGSWPAARWNEFQQGRRALTDELKRPLLTLPTAVATKSKSTALQGQ